MSLGNTLLLGCAVLLSCGGNAERKPATAAGDGPHERDVAPPGDEASSELDPEAPLSPEQPCEGENCFSCGETVCLNGFFCDVGADACGWVPACAAQPSCKCLERELPACRCEARDGGLFVSCE